MVVKEMVVGGGSGLEPQGRGLQTWAVGEPEFPVDVKSWEWER